MASHLPVVPDLLPDSASSAGSVPPAPHRQTWDESTSGSDLVGAILHGSPLQVLLLGAWLAGAAAFLLRTAWGLATLRRIRRGAAPVRDPALREEIGRLARTLGLDPARVQLRVSAEVGSPATWGIVRPVILLPPGVVGAPEAVRRSVVLHEFLHVRRRAWGVRLLALVVCALHWFNPLAWRARRALLAAEEQAVDEAVVGAGVPREDYAAHLLEVVRSLRPLRTPGTAAVLLAEGHSLETRLQNLLRSGDLPGPPSRTAAAAAVVLLGVGTAAVASVEARSPMPGGGQEPVAIAPEPFLQVGVAEGAPDQELYVVRTPFLLPDGRLVVPQRDTRRSGSSGPTVP